MRFLKHATRGALAKLGYQVTRSTNAGVRFENFASLARAYEQQLIDRGEDIPPNALRPELLARLLGTSPSEAYFGSYPAMCANSAWRRARHRR